MSNNDGGDNGNLFSWLSAYDEDLQHIDALLEELNRIEEPPPPPPPPLPASPPPPPPLPPPPQLQPLPYVEIIKQPARRSRFRYRTEMHNRSRGSIRGVDSTPTNETYPTIRINHNGLDTAIVIVSCVTRNELYMVHPHKLFGPSTRDGLYVRKCRLNETNEFELIGIGIHRATKSEVSLALELRAAVRVPEVDPNLQIDPFGCGFNHAANFGNGDLHAVRLAFQVFVQISWGAWQPLAPVVSEPIFNENVPSDLLEIKWVSGLSSSFGGDETVVIELDQRVELNNTEVVFYENNVASNVPLWTRTAHIIRTHYACMTIKTPPCGRMSDDIIIAFFKVRMLSDNRCSVPRQFQYIPDRLGRISQEPIHREQEPRNRGRFQPMARFLEIRVPNYEPDLSSETKRDSSDEEEPFDSTEEESDNSGNDNSEHHNDSYLTDYSQEIQVPNYEPDLSSETERDSSDEEEPFDFTEEESDNSGNDNSEHHNDSSGRDDSEDSIYEALAQLFIDSNVS